MIQKRTSIRSMGVPSTTHINFRVRLLIAYGAAGHATAVESRPLPNTGVEFRGAGRASRGSQPVERALIDLAALLGSCASPGTPSRSLVVTLPYVPLTLPSNQPI